MDLDRVLQFATQAHAGQKRKYTGDDYIVHPVAVAQIVRDFGGSVDQQAAALLHDVVEDTDVTIDQVRDAFELALPRPGFVTNLQQYEQICYVGMTNYKIL